MSDFDAEGFVAAVERLGLLLTAVRFPDGNVRLYRWRMPDAVIHAQRIEALWAAQIGENSDRVRELAVHTLRRNPKRPPPTWAHRVMATTPQ
jgi:hypothetical protein